MKKALLWDHDGVLVETEPLYFEATKHCIAPLGVELELTSYLEDMAHGRPAWERARALGVKEADIVRQRQLRDVQYQELLRTRDIEIPGVEELLAQLSRTYTMAIVTTAKKTDFDLIHKDRNIVPHMDLVLTNGDYARSKPHPDPYLEALRVLDVSADEALVIEDSERGLRAAVAAGIDCAIVHNEFVRGQDFTQARYQLKRLAELPALLANLENDA